MVDHLPRPQGAMVDVPRVDGPFEVKVWAVIVRVLSPPALQKTLADDLVVFPMTL